MKPRKGTQQAVYVGASQEVSSSLLFKIILSRANFFKRRRRDGFRLDFDLKSQKIWKLLLLWLSIASTNIWSQANNQKQVCENLNAELG